MPDRHKNFVLSDQRAASVRIHSCRITNVIAVRLKPSNHWIFFAENPGPAVERAGVERSVVADLERSTIIVISPPAAIEIWAGIIVEGLPRGIGSLKEQSGVAGVIRQPPRCPGA